jgi:L-arabinose isomerase
MADMIPAKPKIGLLLLTAEWFIQVGATRGAFSGLPGRMTEDAENIAAALSPALEIVNPGILATRAQVAKAVKLFERQAVDGVVACHTTWAEDRLIIDAVQHMPGIPFLLWCYSPFQKLPNPMSMADLFRASGPVAAIQASAPLKRLGKAFSFAFGSYQDASTIRKIFSFGKAARLARELRQVTIGVLPYRCDQMTGTYVDEFRLTKEIGPELKYISTHDYRALCEAIPDERLAVFIQDLRAKYRISPLVTDLGLERAARVSLGLAELVSKYCLDAVAIEDVGEELHRVVGLRPCLYVPELFDRAVVSMEAEVGGAVALLMLNRLTGKPPMYTEIFTYDEGENCLLMGHAGMQDIRLADHLDQVMIEPDGEYAETEPDSAWMSFRGRGGRVTLLSVFCDLDRFKLVISTGEALAGERKLLGSPHIYVKLEQPLAQFFERSIRTGMTQHWALVHEEVIDELVILAEILGLNQVIL